MTSLWDVADPRTLAIIKPDAVERGLLGPILTMITEDPGLRIFRMRRLILDRSEAEEFYREHRGRPYFEPLITFIISGAIYALDLGGVRGSDPVSCWRALMGPAKVEDRGPETIRGRFSKDVMLNCVHGSDSPEAAQRELRLLMPSTRF